MKQFREFFSQLDLSDVRLLIAGCVLLLLPLFFFMFLSGGSKNISQTQRYSITTTSRASAFNLTSSKKSATGRGLPGKTSGSGFNLRAEKIDEELDKAWDRIQRIPKTRKYPLGISKDTRKLYEAEDDEAITTGNSLIDSGDLAGAEAVFKEVIKNSQGNEFKELYAYGGLMEVYQQMGNVVKFREAFGKYVTAAQKLKHVYGPLADNIARAQQMFDQLAKADPALVREQLLKSNLANGTNVDYDQFMKSMNHTQEWFPTGLSEPEPKMPSYLRSGFDG